MKRISTVVVEEKAKAFAEKECPIKTEDDYYKDNVDDPYYDYRVERQLVQARLRHAFKAGYDASEGEEAIGGLLKVCKSLLVISKKYSFENWNESRDIELAELAIEKYKL